MRHKVIYSACTDEQLVNLIKEDDQAAFVFVYDKHWAEMYACAYKLFQDRETCEDLIHDVFLSIWTAREKLNIKSIRDYLYIAVKNRALNKIRSNKKHLSLLDFDYETLIDSKSSDEFLNMKEINAVFEKGITTLPAKCREILVMSRKEHLSNKEIASRLNITPKTVENHINNALRKIRLAMGELLSVFLF